MSNSEILPSSSEQDQFRQLRPHQMAPIRLSQNENIEVSFNSFIFNSLIFEDSKMILSR